MQGTLSKASPISPVFEHLRSEIHHHRLFAWGNWEGATAELGAGLRAEISPDHGIHWFPYHEGVYSEIEDEETGDTSEELEYPTLEGDGYIILKDISGLSVRIILIEAGDNTKLDFRLV